jgi:maltose alpha-D-glucosyltransferase/alpha-amylase
MDQQVATFEAESLSALLERPLPAPFERLLMGHIRSSRWFRGKARELRTLEILDLIPLSAAPDEVLLTVARVSYSAEQSEVYVFPLGFATGASADAVPGHRRLFAVHSPASITARVGVAYDPSGGEALSNLLFEMFVRAETSGARGCLRAVPANALLARMGPGQPPLTARQSHAEQSNTTVFLGREFMLKLFRQLTSFCGPTATRMCPSRSGASGTRAPA